MAKKPISRIQKGAGKAFTKVIKMVKSPETGAYTFKTDMVSNDLVNDFFQKKEN